jgi:hypothetical protein
MARFSPGYNIAGLQPFDPVYDLSHLGKSIVEESQQRLIC